MTPKERAAMQQALEALEEAREMIGYPANMVLYEEELALREALAEPDIEEMTLTQIAARHEQAEQEPVAWVAEDVCDGQFINGRKRRIWWECIEGAGTPLYAAPVRTKDLTEDEIYKLVKQVRFDGMTDRTFQFARAVIAADREKNK